MEDKEKLIVKYILLYILLFSIFVISIAMLWYLTIKLLFSVFTRNSATILLLFCLTSIFSINIFALLYFLEKKIDRLLGIDNEQTN